MKTLKILCLSCLIVSWLFPYWTEHNYARYDGFAFILDRSDRHIDFPRLILIQVTIIGVFGIIMIAVDRKR